ncbi:endonuclease domain-containing protein [Streptomyces erythrochromogenes]|uniref:endonuclease domain-containing protein n=1 Tax=Streptomyces erythrochromogenes TaxID=285574 RepID=UPI00342BCF15
MPDTTTPTPACWAWPAVCPTPQAVRAWHLERLSVPDRSQLNALLLAAIDAKGDTGTLEIWQAGRCAVCGGTGLRLVTDHDHGTGLVRGLLCSSCNTREGHSYGPRAGRNVFTAYRERPPTAILGLSIRYWDPTAKEFARPMPPRHGTDFGDMPPLF